MHSARYAPEMTLRVTGFKLYVCLFVEYGLYAQDCVVVMEARRTYQIAVCADVADFFEGARFWMVRRAHNLWSTWYGDNNLGTMCLCCVLRFSGGLCECLGGLARCAQLLSSAKKSGADKKCGR